MSRIGYKAVELPAGVEVKQDGNVVTVKGPKGELTREFSDLIKINVEGNVVTFERSSDDNKSKSLHGTTRANFHNMVVGVSEGFKKELELRGVGYRAQMQGKKLVLNVGYSHPVEFEEEDGIISANILQIDSRFVSLIKWLGENHINVRLSGENRSEGYAVYKIRETEFGGGAKLSANDGFLQFMIERLLASDAPSEEEKSEEEEEEEALGDDMKLTSMQSIIDFMHCAGRTLPDNIRLWARRNLAVARSSEVSPEERRHAQRALSMAMNIRWKSNYFEAIDPDEARRILDEELYGMEKVKQRIIETIIQINRTHTLPAYGLLLCGPAGTGKSQIAYAVARILRLPWTTLDMSSINDPEQLTGSSRV